MAAFAVINLLGAPDPDEQFKRRAHSNTDDQGHAELVAHLRADHLASSARPFRLASPTKPSTAELATTEVHGRYRMNPSATAALGPDTTKKKSFTGAAEQTDQSQRAIQVPDPQSATLEALASAERNEEINADLAPSSTSGPKPGLVQLARSTPSHSLRLEGAATLRQPCDPPAVDLAPLPAGRSLIKISSGCRANTSVILKYAGVLFRRSLDDAGELSFEIDLFAGTASSVLIKFADGVEEDHEVVAHDLQRLSKVAVIWKAPVDLDLHAFEYAASFGERGHIWSGQTSSVEHAAAKALDERQGRGFMSTWSTGSGKGDRLEVYTFWHSMRQATGVIKLGIDYKSRGDLPQGEFCRGGSYAKVDYKALLMSRNRIVRRISGGFAPADCGVPLKRRARYNSKAIPDIAAAY